MSETTDTLYRALLDLGAWLSLRLGTDTLESRVWIAGPLGAAYRWDNTSKQERFLLALKLSPERLKILNLWIPRSMRGQGVGTAVVRHLAELCAGYHIPSMAIEPRPGSEGFWRKAGFVPVQSNPTVWRYDVE